MSEWEMSERVQCPHCGQSFELVFDTTQGRQEFTTECEICCRPSAGSSASVQIEYLGNEDASRKKIRDGWNRSAPSEFALPTEIWREVVARRQRYHEIRQQIEKGEVREINDLVTYNLDIRQFAQDMVTAIEAPELLPQHPSRHLIEI